VSISATNLTAFHSTVYIGIGSNLDRPVQHVSDAIRDIDELPETALASVSSFYQSAPVGLADQPAFINAVVQVETVQSPQQLMLLLLAIESRHGRVRGPDEARNGPRTLDLDILIFNEWRLDEPDLMIPHPRAHERAFVLRPLLEIAPDLYIPGKGLARDFLAAVSEQTIVRLTFDREGAAA